MVDPIKVPISEYQLRVVQSLEAELAAYRSTIQTEINKILLLIVSGQHDPKSLLHWSIKVVEGEIVCTPPKPEEVKSE